jgi:hypothetical protein
VILPLDLIELHRDWRGWTLGRDGRLYFDGWRRGFEPGELAGLMYRLALVKALERTNATLQIELERRVAECELAEKRAAFYRAQVQAESRLGFLLGLSRD